MWSKTERNRNRKIYFDDVDSSPTSPTEPTTEPVTPKPKDKPKGKAKAKVAPVEQPDEQLVEVTEVAVTPTTSAEVAVAVAPPIETIKRVTSQLTLLHFL